MKLKTTLLATIASVSASHAALVSVNLTNTNGPRQIQSGESTGVISTTDWANVSSSTTNISGSGVDATLAGTISASNTLRDGAPADGTDGFLALFEGGLKDSTAGSATDTSITLSNLSALLAAEGHTSYRIIAYYKSAVNVTTADSFQLQLDSNTPVITNTPDNSNISASDSFVKLGSVENNWMEFTNLTSDTATIAINRISRDGVLVGLQLETVPEPSSTALLGLGGLALIMRRRK